MARQTKRSMLPAAFFLTGALLLGFGVYLWTYDYGQGQARDPNDLNAVNPPSDPPTNLNAFLVLVHPSQQNVNALEVGHEIVAELRIQNEGPKSCRFLDSPSMDALYSLTLFGPDGRSQTARFTRGSRGPLLSSENPEKHYRLVELLPGRSLTVTFPLNKYFTLKRAGAYRLRAAYSPGLLASVLHLDLAELEVASKLNGSLQVPFVLNAGKKKE